jgi:hypothetical protein
MGWSSSSGQDESLQLRLSAFFETADADEDRFSFDEVRTRRRGRLAAR